MNALDWILVAIRWAHALAAVAWVGGGIFYLMVLRPAFRRSNGDEKASRAIGEEFRGLVNTAIAVLLLTGVILSVSRLTDSAATIPYVAALVVKVLLALYMFYVVRFLRPGVYPGDAESATGWVAKARGRFTGTTALLIYGVLIIGLSDVLDALFEWGLSG
jgi:uncharacterized membrane protein